MKKRELELRKEEIARLDLKKETLKPHEKAFKCLKLGIMIKVCRLSECNFFNKCMGAI